MEKDGRWQEAAFHTSRVKRYISNTPWMKFTQWQVWREDKLGWVLPERACPLTGIWMIFETTEPFANNQSSLMKTSSPSCPYVQCALISPHATEAKKGELRCLAWNAQAFPSTKAQICTMAETEGQKWAKTKWNNNKKRAACSSTFS